MNLTLKASAAGEACLLQAMVGLSDIGTSAWIEIRRPFSRTGTAARVARSEVLNGARHQAPDRV